MKTMKHCKSALWLVVLALCVPLLLAGCGSSAKSVQEDVSVENIAGVTDAPQAAEESALPPVSETMTALEDARAYLETMSLSRAMLISQLEYDGFTTEEAEEAAEQCGADWNEQAVRQAKSYLDIMEFTYEELVDQLEYDKFTPEQAVYGADNCGASW